MESGVTEQWFSYDAGSGPGNPGAGVKAFSRYLKEIDDGIVVDVARWEGMQVPATEPLPYVEGKPTV